MAISYNVWDVYRKGNLLDTVYYASDISEETVKDLLISEAHYPTDIKIFESPKKQRKDLPCVKLPNRN